MKPLADFERLNPGRFKNFSSGIRAINIIDLVPGSEIEKELL
jgi:hypothetical protein